MAGPVPQNARPPDVDRRSREAQPGRPEFVGSEIGEGVEGERVRGVLIAVVAGHEVEVVLEHLEPVELLPLGGVSFAVLLTPGFEELRRGRGGGGGETEVEVEDEEEREEA